VGLGVVEDGLCVRIGNGTGREERKFQKQNSPCDGHKLPRYKAGSTMTFKELLPLTRELLDAITLNY
jgi:hypothetical protein